MGEHASDSTVDSGQDAFGRLLPDFSMFPFCNVAQTAVLLRGGQRLFQQVSCLQNKDNTGLAIA
jgi:hypothetical protein